MERLMNNFKRVLSGEDIEQVITSIGIKPEFSYRQVAVAIEQAVLAKLTEQDPVAWFTEDHLTDRSATTYDPAVRARWEYKGWPVSPLYAHPCVSPTSHKHDCVSEIAESETQTIKPVFDSDFVLTLANDLIQYANEMRRKYAGEDNE